MTHILLRTIGLLAVTLMFALGLPARAQEPAETSRVYLPQLQLEPGPNVFGIEMSRLTSAQGIDLVRASSTRWIRRNALRWKDIEPVEGGGYRWDSPVVKALEADLVAAAKLGINMILVVHGSPRWATTPYQADCAPISSDKQDEFARFLAAAAARYSQPPYNLRYLEIGNEPDAFVFATDSVFGCWGIEGDPYYGGEAFGRMLRLVTPAIRRAAPQMQILNGGLLLFRPYDPQDSTTLPGRFFEGMLRAGAGNSFDIVSFHTYVYFGPGGPSPLGPREDWRVSYLRDLMRRYRLPEKPMIRTEAALLCPQVTPECRWAQADLVGRTYARAMRDGLLGNIWYVYDNDSFHNTAMIEPREAFVPRPAYFAYRHVSQTLANATYVGPLGDQPAAVEAYRFSRGKATLVIFWSDTGGTLTMQVPAGARLTCSDRDGGPLPCAAVGGQLSLPALVSPQFVVLQP